MPIPEPLRQELEAAAMRLRLRLALVGGAVRDLLRHRQHRDPWHGLPDLDLVVDELAPSTACAGSDPAAHRLARALLAADPESVAFCRFHSAYGTVELEMHGVLLDLASARAETYLRPAENPIVHSGRLEDDLARRDLSINAMALLLQPGREPVLLDPLGGRADLAARCLRFLHADAMGDDPTRLVRAARYGARLGFNLEPASLDQAHRTVVSWPWAWRHGDPPEQAPPALGTRLRMELELLLEREPWPAALTLLQDWGGLTLLDEGLQRDRDWRRRLRWAQRFGVPLMPALLAGADDPLGLAERLQVPHRQHRVLAQWLALRARLRRELPLPDRPSTWCALLESAGFSSEAVALALASGDGPRRPLLRWWLQWRHVKAPISAAELIAAGMEPGPALGARLQQERAALLDQPGAA